MLRPVAQLLGVAALLALTRYPAATAAAGLQVEVLAVPEQCPIKSQAGDTLAVHYLGYMRDIPPGSDGWFDESYLRNESFVFKIGSKQVIEGWETGLLDMCIGERRQLTVPPELAYGSRGMGRIIGGSTLIYRIELMDIRNRKEELIEKAIQMNNVVVFGRRECPNTQRAKSLLDRDVNGAKPPAIFYLDELEGGPTLQDYIRRKTGHLNLPRVFIHQKHVGGSDALLKLHESGRLPSLIAGLSETVPSNMSAMPIVAGLLVFVLLGYAAMTYLRPGRRSKRVGKIR